MNRRSFVGLCVSAIAMLPLTGLASTPDKMKLTIHHEPEHGWTRVTGSFEAKKKFHHVWQTKLWPEWQQHMRPMEERTSFLWNMMEGYDALFSTRSKECASALEFAIKNCGCVITVI
jgi:hypothetical protein